MTTATKNPMVGMTLLYASASRGRQDDRDVLLKLTPKQREAHAPICLLGQGREVFIATGKTFSEQVAEERSTNQKQGQENTMTTTKNSKKTSRITTSRKGGQTTRTAQRAAGGVGVRELAAQMKVDPRALRVLLRELNMGTGRGKRYTFTAAQITKVKAAHTKATSKAK